MCTFVYMCVYIVKVDLQILFSFFFSRMQIFVFAGKMLQHDATAENTTLLYIVYRAFKLTEILECNAEINFAMKENRELTYFYVN